jgi:5-deoxy-glucuronate isomerase
MSYHAHYEGGNGLTWLTKPGQDSLKYIGFGMIDLEAGQQAGDTVADMEITLVVLSGTCTVEAGGEKFENIGERTDVFSGRAAAVYLPPGVAFSVTAVNTCQVAVCGAPASKGGPVKLITPADNKSKVVGTGNYTRNVHDIIDMDCEAERLVIGETVNPPGNWSSYPPHKHDEDNLPAESKLEELYFYKLKPSQGFALQRLYTADGSMDETYTIQDNDYMALPKGYHPICAGGGYELCYLWILAGENRTLAPNDDPAHTWIRQQDA